MEAARMVGCCEGCVRGGVFWRAVSEGQREHARAVGGGGEREEEEEEV